MSAKKTLMPIYDNLYSMLKENMEKDCNETNNECVKYIISEIEKNIKIHSYSFKNKNEISFYILLPPYFNYDNDNDNVEYKTNHQKNLNTVVAQLITNYGFPKDTIIRQNGFYYHPLLNITLIGEPSEKIERNC